MTTRFKILPYRQGSRSAKALARALNTRVLRLENSHWKQRPDDKVINWGNTTPQPYHSVLNPPEEIRKASNKLLFFQLLSGTGLTPDFWTNQKDIPDDAFPVVCRTVLSGHSGEGIHIAADRAGLVPASLYVRYVKKTDEYRVHVGRSGEGTSIIAVQRKARRNDRDSDTVNWQVRNLAGGFVYVRNDVNPPVSVLEAAVDALGHTELDFGAVDVIWNSKQERAYVLEINTAPGLEGQTIEDYASFFKGLNNG